MWTWKEMGMRMLSRDGMEDNAKHKAKMDSVQNMKKIMKTHEEKRTPANVRRKRV